MEKPRKNKIPRVDSDSFGEEAGKAAMSQTLTPCEFATPGSPLLLILTDTGSPRALREQLGSLDRHLCLSGLRGLWWGAGGGHWAVEGWPPRLPKSNAPGLGNWSLEVCILSLYLLI